MSVPQGVRHIPYWNSYLGEDYCHADGEPWPCLHHRQTNTRCKCSHGRSLHTRGQRNCWVSVCACGEFRPEETK